MTFAFSASYSGVIRDDYGFKDPLLNVATEEPVTTAPAVVVEALAVAAAAVFKLVDLVGAVLRLADAAEIEVLVVGPVTTYPITAEGGA